MKKNLISKLFNFIELIVNARIAYNNVKDDPEVAKTTKTFGKRSLVYFLAFLGMAAITAGLIYFCITRFVSTLILLAIGAVILSVYTAIYSIGMFILSFNLAIKQNKLNKNPIGIMALILNIIVLVALVLGIVVLILAIKLS